MIDTSSELDICLDINMDIEPQCEHIEHGKRSDHETGNAAYLISRWSRCSGRQPNMLICNQLWASASSMGTVLCPVCWEPMPVFNAWKIIEVL